MNGLSSLSTGTSGLQAALRAFDRAAGGPDRVDSVVGMRVAAHDVKANIAVVRTADEMLGTLLDIKA